MKRKPNIKTNIAEKVNHYHKIVNVKNQEEFNKKHGYLEHGLGKCLETFFDTEFQGGSKKKELRIYEINNEKNLEKTDELYGNTILLIVASCWDPYIVKDLLKEGCDIYKLNKNGDSILHIVCRGHFDDVAESLINELNCFYFDI